MSDLNFDLNPTNTENNNSQLSNSFTNLTNSGFCLDLYIHVVNKSLFICCDIK